MAASTNPRVKAFHTMLRETISKNTPENFYFGRPTYQAGYGTRSRPVVRNIHNKTSMTLKEWKTNDHDPNAKNMQIGSSKIPNVNFEQVIRIPSDVDSDYQQKTLDYIRKGQAKKMGLRTKSMLQNQTHGIVNVYPHKGSLLQHNPFIDPESKKRNEFTAGYGEFTGFPKARFASQKRDRGTSGDIGELVVSHRLKNVQSQEIEVADPGCAINPINSQKNQSNGPELSPIPTKPLTAANLLSKTLQKSDQQNKTLDIDAPDTHYLPEPDSDWRRFPRARAAHIKQAQFNDSKTHRPMVKNFLTQSLLAVRDSQQNSQIKQKYEARHGRRYIDNGIYDKIDQKITWRPSTSLNPPPGNVNTDDFTGQKSQQSERLKVFDGPDQKFQGSLRGDLTAKTPMDKVIALEDRNKNRLRP
jgi:hypothetical protein